MNLKIIEPIKKPNKEFNTPDEFNLWYNKNKETIDSQTTHKLNKMYHINGYRITKIKGVLMLKKDKDDEENYFESEIELLQNQITKIKEEQNEMKKAIAEIIKAINS